MSPTTRLHQNNNIPPSSWLTDFINGGSLRQVDLTTGTNGWASPPGDVFHLRSKHYLTTKSKTPASADYLLSPAGMDWLKSHTKLDHILSNPSHRFNKNNAKKSPEHFVIAINLQIPCKKDHHNAVFYFATEYKIPSGSLLERFVNGSDEFRNSRFKIVNRIVKGPWIVKKAVGNYGVCLLGKALKCSYYRGDGYLEIDVDIGSSAIASAILHLALGYVTSVSVDMGFLVEGREEFELPERLFGAVRVCQIEMGSARVVDWIGSTTAGMRGLGCNKVRDEDDDAVV